jgi:hypothetical protein
MYRRTPVSVSQLFPEDLLRNYSQSVNNTIDNMYIQENTTNYYQETEEDEIDKKYLIGSCIYVNRIGYLLASCITPSTFFTQTYDLVTLYLKVSSVYYIETPSVDILQLCIEDDYYFAIKKTYWLRLVQRHWKNVFQKRKNIIRKRCLPQNLQYRSIYGFFPKGLNVLPGIKGLLSCYTTTYQT